VPHLKDPGWLNYPTLGMSLLKSVKIAMRTRNKIGPAFKDLPRGGVAHDH
jgi:hypothetical protein